MEKYIELKENNRASHLKIELYYALGGYNYFTHKSEERGYYLSVSPVTRESRGGCTMESYTAFSGVKKCVKTVSRKSAKAEAEAEKLAADLEASLIDYVCAKNDLEAVRRFQTGKYGEV